MTLVLERVVIYQIDPVVLHDPFLEREYGLVSLEPVHAYCGTLWIISIGTSLLVAQITRSS